MTRSIYFLFIFTLAFAPKIGGVDLSVVIPVVLLPFICRSRVVVPRGFLLMGALLLWLLAYQLLVQMVYGAFDIISTGRLIRALLDVMLVGVLLGTAKSAGHSYQMVALPLLLCLFVHAALVVLAAVYSPLNHGLSAVSSNDRVGLFRASGLLAGFDIAGFMSVIGMAVILSRICVVRRRATTLVFMAVFLLSCLFTSRVSMVMGIVLFCVYLLMLMRERRLPVTYKIVFISLLGVAGYAVAYQMFLIFGVTMGLDIANVSASKVDVIRSTNASFFSDLAGYKGMFFIPTTGLQVIFGTGHGTLTSDVGYVNQIFSYGIFGLVIAILAHLFFVVDSFGTIASRALKNHVALVVFIFISMLVLTFKNDYLFVRGVFPVFLLIVGCAFLNSTGFAMVEPCTYASDRKGYA